MKWPKISPADVSWQDGTTPLARDFGDIYFLPGKGLAEKQYVFQEGVNLEVLCRGKSQVNVGEIGFGSGLNFLLAWNTARQHKTRLNYLAVEGFPLKKTDLEKVLKAALVNSPEGIHQISDVFVNKHPPLLPGFQRVVFDEGLVTLTLVMGDVMEALPQISGQFDAWFLDGFSPDKNPDMWSKPVFSEIVRLSAPGARLATYSAAGKVRRSLEKVGFKVEKRKGYDRKRECLAAIFEGGPEKKTLSKGARIAVVGGGIAGCSAAFALRRKGYAVTLFERENSLAAGTSGNPVALFKPKFQKTLNPYSAFFLGAYAFSYGLARDLKQLRQTMNQAQGDKCPGFLGQHSFHSENDAKGFLAGGWIIPKDLCKALTEGAKVRLNTPFPNSGDFEAVIWANGLNSFDAFGTSPYRLTRGQLNYLPAVSGKDIGPLTFPGGYLTPATKDGFHVLGTSYKAWDNPDDLSWKTLSQADLDKNLAALYKAHPDLADLWQDPALVGRAALRVETIDHLPVVGPAFDEAKFETVFKEKQKLHHSRRTITDEADIVGHYILSGFASRGFTAAPYAAEILASEITGSPLPCPNFVREALAPTRFVLKALKSGKV